MSLTKFIEVHLADCKTTCAERDRLESELARVREVNAELAALLIEAIEDSGFSVSGPTDIRVAEHEETHWVCNTRAALAKHKAQ